MLTERQLNILGLLIQTYTSSGVPVGSKTLVDAGIKASSATIRNDLSTLEEVGFIEKTHSSSGRIPSVKGYRYYVDNLLKPSEVSKQELSLIKGAFGQEYRAIDDIIAKSAQILSDLTSYTAFSLGPEVKERKLTGFRVVPLNNHQLMAIIVTDRGNVESQVFTIPDGVSAEDIEKMIKIINDKLVGQPLLTVYHKLRTEIPMILQKYFHSPTGIMTLFDTIMGQAFEERVFVSGKMNLLDLDVLSDVSQFKSVYSLMDNTDQLTALIAPTEADIDIRIGNELENDLLTNMSLITASYEVAGHGKGTIALLGPTNMSYEKMLGLVDAFRTELSQELTDYYRLLE
ncbi:heat-inducible transcriptional repressor HrcA [Vagococcus sp. PNs007]|uniref:Heat-inducible transcription repressor HrcA n=1 Tax=Vagococcus proximus TaxID=2991417 RepID=A0ABT5WYY0_9ENTE|nr:heat-inducible transcriptional repressor HrcA [Vagococcus proximus]MDF0478796.1 heat-inducible transcriptional repressor HrcA [Vagococcus proximus]